MHEIAWFGERNALQQKAQETTSHLHKQGQLPILWPLPLQMITYFCTLQLVIKIKINGSFVDIVYFSQTPTDICIVIAILCFGT